MLPLYLSEDDDYPDSSSLSYKSSATKSSHHCGESSDPIYNVYGDICGIHGTVKICEKYEKRLREKKAKFAFKEHSNVYYKPEWVCAPGYDYPGPQHIPHKLVTAVRAKKIVCKQEHKAEQEHKAKWVAISKKKLRRPSKYVLEHE